MVYELDNPPDIGAVHLAVYNIYDGYRHAVYKRADNILGDGILVSSYWAALWASFIVSTLSWAIAMARSEKIIRKVLKKDSEKSKDDDVIDI